MGRESTIILTWLVLGRAVELNTDVLIQIDVDFVIDNELTLGPRPCQTNLDNNPKVEINKQ